MPYSAGPYWFPHGGAKVYRDPGTQTGGSWRKPAGSPRQTARNCESQQKLRDPEGDPKIGPGVQYAAYKTLLKPHANLIKTYLNFVKTN